MGGTGGAGGLRALVVEDSAFQRLRISEALREVQGVSVVEAASTGEDAIKKLLSSSFDIVTLDIGLPGMDGHAVLRWIMSHRPVPVVVISGNQQQRDALLALEAGALEVLGKASAQPEALARWKRRLAEAVEGVRQISLESLVLRSVRRSAAPGIAGAPPAHTGRVLPSGSSGAGPPAVVVAASTGGPPALRDLFQAMETREAIVAVAQHMPPPFTRSLAARLSTGTGWEAREATDGDVARAGVVWIAPGGKNRELVREGAAVSLHVTTNNGRSRWCPSGDLLFTSAARSFGPRVVAVVLTGMGDDGALGARAVGEAGGVVICEGRETAVIPGMPDSVARTVPSALRLPLHEIGAGVTRSLESL